MEIALQVALLSAAAVAAVALGILRQRRASLGRRQANELREIEEHVSARIAALIRGPAATPAEEWAPTAEPPLVEPAPVRAPTVEPQQVLPSPIELPPVEAPTVEPQPVEPQPVEPLPVEPEPVEPEPVEPQPEEEVVPVAAAVPLERTSPQATSVRTHPPGATPERRAGRRRLLGAVVGASAVIVLLVVIGAQVLPGLGRPGGSGTLSTPTEFAGGGATASPRPSTVPTASPPETPAPTPTSGVTPQPTPTPVPTPIVYVVRTGDTMWMIAATYNVSLADLIAENPQIADPNKIYAGNRVTIPTATLAPSASP